MTDGLILTSLPEMSIITYNFNIYSNIHFCISFIFTVIENFGICKFSRIYLLNLKRKKKPTEITLLARMLALSFNILNSFLRLTNIYSPFYFQFLFITT